MDQAVEMVNSLFSGSSLGFVDQFKSLSFTYWVANSMEMLERLGIPQPNNGIATTADEAEDVASSIGYPVVVRPSYVLAGRGMDIVYDQ